MKNLSVSKKLILTFSIVMLLLLAMITMFIGHSKTVIRNINAMIHHPFRVSGTAKDIRSDLYLFRVSVKETIQAADSDEITSLESGIRSTEENIESMLDEMDRAHLGDAAELKRLRDAFTGLSMHRIVMVELARTDREEAYRLYVENFDKMVDDCFLMIDRITASADQQADDLIAQAVKADRMAETLNYCIVGVAVVVSVVLIVVLTRDITGPLKQIVGVIQRVNRGEKPGCIEVSQRRDELGEVARAFNGMLQYLKTEEELKERNWSLQNQKMLEQFRITLMSIGDAVISTDAGGNVASMNPAAERMTGWSLFESVGKPVGTVFNIINHRTGKPAPNPIDEVLRKKEVVNLARHTVLVSRSGERLHIADSAAPILDNGGALQGVVLVFHDITDDYRRQEEIAYISFHDRLTDLYNRAFLEEELARISTARQMPLSVIVGDVNGLKLANDAFGHETGDRYLIAAADAFRKSCRAEDVIARWGGDEFVVLLPKTPIEDCRRICDRISQTFASAEGFAFTPGIALGCAVATEGDAEPRKALKEAEAAMYRHKLMDGQAVRGAIVSSLVRTLEGMRSWAGGQAARVAGASRSVGERLGMGEEALRTLGDLLRLYDIGKVAIDSRILKKPGKLDRREWAEVKRHAETGYRIALSIAELEPLAAGILAHHERWDGAGYPRGLAGGDIPLESRIAAVADAYGAMTEGRPYKPAVSHEEAVEELKRCAGSQFDPDVVRLFTEALNESRRM